MKVIGICLVQNDDRFLYQVLQNVIDFCDELILVEHRSTDKTPEICDHFARKYTHVEYHKIGHPSESHGFLESYAGTNSWVFGVDGDEIYDPGGLAKLKQQLKNGRFADKWQVFGKVLHITDIDLESENATGYMARPSRPINKLYNFSLIDSWKGPCSERLHNGNIVFRDPTNDRQNKDESESYLEWNESVFRCLHAAFVWRSSVQEGFNRARPNIEEVRQYSKLAKLLFRLKHVLRLKVESKSKAPYRVGPQVSVGTTPFFS